MNTSYFAKHKDTNGVSISSYTPKWFKGREYKKLAPTNVILFKYKKDYNIADYIEAYQKEVLDKLDPNVIYAELGESVVLLCYERTGEFCHRHLVAKWLNEKLNINITEL